MKTVVVYGGRFQPPHKGHKASYDHLVDRFGANSVFMSSADKAQGPNDPFTWEEKKRIAVSMGIPANKFLKIQNPYTESVIHEVLPYNRKDTVLIVALSEKDADRLVSNQRDDEGYAIKKDGSRQAIQWLGKDPLPVASGHYYVVATPTVEFQIGGKDIASSSEIRGMYASATPNQRNRLLVDLYGEATPQLRQLFDNRLGTIQTESLLREYLDFINKF